MADHISPGAGFTFRAAQANDVPVILDFIKQLAAHVRMPERVTATEDILRDTLFGTPPAASVIVAECDDEPAGFAVFFPCYSTFEGQPGIYLEDLFVHPRWRSLGLGRQLLAELARLAIARGGGRLEWSVLASNEIALRAYRSVGATTVDGLLTQRLSGDSLRDLASHAPGTTFNSEGPERK